MKKKKNKKFLIIIFASVFFAIFFIGGWSIVDENYDKQNKIILSIKELVPTNISRKVRNIVFVIPDLKTLNKDLKRQVQKYEQGFEGQLFNEKKVTYGDKKIDLKSFFLPFPRLDVRAGYTSTVNSSRAHYLEIVKDKVIAISGLGKIVFFNKNNILNKKLDQKEIPNNLQNLLKKNNLEFVGLRDLFIQDNKVYVSCVFKDKNGYSFNIYRANLNYKELNFETFFKANAYFKNYSVSSGGRIEKFKNNKILFSLGNSRVKGAAQDKKSLLGKIISIDLNTKEVEMMSLGHRNPQGLVYVEDLNLIINSEHGPKGGDEINLNFLNENKVPNFGFDTVSYGIEYDGTDPYKRGKTKKPHTEFGFVEPFIYYIPSIGISEVVFLNKEKSFLNRNTLFVSSLRAGSIYVYELNDELSKVEKETRINFGNERIRDIKYDPENEVFLLLLELTPAIGVLKF